MTGKILLDPDGVTDLVSRFRRVADELRGSKRDFNDDGAIHSTLIDDALDDFNHDWSDKRGEIVKALDGAAEFVANVVREITNADTSLSKAVGGGK